MSPTWQSEDLPEPVPVGVTGGVLAVLKGAAMGVVLIVGVLVKLALRLLELPFHGAVRPWSGWVTVAVCRIALVLMGLRLTNEGTPMRGQGAFVANHSSWLDIFVLNAGTPLFFVSKAEVAGWPGIGWLARITGTVFVRRDRREASQQRAMLEDRMALGHRLLFFPEGTSTDGRRVLPFKPTLFAALLSDRMSDAKVQPVTVVYTAAEGRDPRFYGWWGDMGFGPHLVQLLASSGSGQVTVTWHAPLKVSEFADRKALARAAEDMVRKPHPQGQVSV
ncbi:MAG: lysophospholipid acyltransferase family protein [Pseudomonadota bacterium]